MLPRSPFALAVLLVTIACGGVASAPSPSPEAAASLNVGYSEPVADNLPLYIAQDSALFTRRSLTVNVQQITSTQGIPALLSGQIDIDDIGGSEVMSAAAQGADLVILGTLTPFSPYSLYVGPAIGSAADLKGKKVATTRAGASLDIALHTALQKYGLDPEKDVDYLQTGSVPNVISAMLSGQTEATVSKPPESLKLAPKGIKPVLDLAKDRIPASNTCIVARRSWVAGHRDVVQRYVDSIVEAIGRERKDRAYAIDELAKWTKNSDQAANAASYDLFSQLVQPLPYGKPEQLAAAKAQLGKSNDKVRTFDLTRLYDNSFVRSAGNRGLGLAGTAGVAVGLHLVQRGGREPGGGSGAR